MDAELARVQIDEIGSLKERKRLTLLIDGWEDILKCSFYGVLATEVNHYPVVLKLADMLRCRGSSDALLEVANQALKSMEVGDVRGFIAATTDNPTVMQAFCWKLKDQFYWILVSNDADFIDLCSL